MITCPSCGGHKRSVVFLCSPRVRNNVQHLPCSTCKGAGEITHEHHNIIRRGQALSELRINSDLSLREVAKLLGLGAYVYSQLEHGDPAMWAQYGERAFDLLRTRGRRAKREEP